MKKINQLRKEIDKIDSEIIDLISRRIEIAKKIGIQKKKEKLSIVDKIREEKIKETWFLESRNKGLESKYLQNIMKEILKMSKEHQRRIKH